jgi:hypothetical protein
MKSARANRAVRHAAVAMNKASALRNTDETGAARAVSGSLSHPHRAS